MFVNSKLLPATFFVWAGVSLAGNLIVAPAKFRVETLTTAELLQVGRAQFAWVGIAEIFLLLLCVFGWFQAKRRPTWVFATIVLIFGMQQLILQPMLQGRSDLIIAGVDAGESHLHLIFIAAEVVKFLLLTIAGYRLIPSEISRDSASI